MHHVAAPPTPNELAALLAMLLEDPRLFIGSSTVMTTALLGATLCVAALAAVMAVVGSLAEATSRLAHTALRMVAPKLALILVYFGAGSMLLATAILVRFHGTIPQETELQFRSGLGHLALASVGLMLLVPALRGLNRAMWLRANLWAVGYWTVHIIFLTPPWFSFQGQRDLLISSAMGLLGTSALASLLALRAAQRSSLSAMPRVEPPRPVP